MLFSIWLHWLFRKTTEKCDMSLELNMCEKAIYSNKRNSSAGLSRLESERCLVNSPRLAIENVWTGTHSFYLGGHLEIECWVAFSLPLTGRLSFSLPRFLSSAPLTAKLHKEWWMLMETHGVVIMDHLGVLRKDGDRQTETEKERRLQAQNG